MNPTEIQLMSAREKSVSKQKYMEMLIEFEKLRHNNVMKEIEALKKAKVKSFNRDGIRQEKDKEIKE